MKCLKQIVMLLSINSGLYQTVHSWLWQCLRRILPFWRHVF